MTGADFKAWRLNLKLSQHGAAVALGCAKSTVIAYEKGGAVPRYIALACSAVAFGLVPYRPDTSKGGK